MEYTYKKLSVEHTYKNASVECIYNVFIMCMSIIFITYLSSQCDNNLLVEIINNVSVECINNLSVKCIYNSSALRIYFLLSSVFILSSCLFAIGKWRSIHIVHKIILYMSVHSRWILQGRTHLSRIMLIRNMTLMFMFNFMKSYFIEHRTAELIRTDPSTPTPTPQASMLSTEFGICFANVSFHINTGYL